MNEKIKKFFLYLAKNNFKINFFIPKKWLYKAKKITNKKFIDF